MITQHINDIKQFSKEVEMCQSMHEKCHRLSSAIGKVQMTIALGFHFSPAKMAVIERANEHTLARTLGKKRELVQPLQESELYSKVVHLPASLFQAGPRQGAPENPVSSILSSLEHLVNSQHVEREEWRVTELLEGESCKPGPMGNCGNLGSCVARLGLAVFTMKFLLIS